MDLNVDAGEGYGSWGAADEAALLRNATSVNLACGFHAGDPRTMEAAVSAAARLGLAVGAHPAYPDLVGFGRRPLAAAADEVRTDVLYQLGAISAFCRAAGVALRHVKPHGALYNVAQRDAATAGAVCDAVRAFDPALVVLTLPGHALERAARERGLAVAREGFADRGRRPDGTLVPRGEPGALLAEPGQAAAQAVELARGGAVDSLCVHSDTPGAAAVLAAVRAALEAAGFTVAAAVNGWPNP